MKKRTLLVIPAALALVALLVVAFVRRDPPVRLSGSTCEELAQSYGAEVERGQMEIVERPWDIEKDDTRSGELGDARLAVARALDEVWDPRTPLDNCSPERFLSLVERELGPRFRREVPAAHVDIGPKPEWSWYRDILGRDIAGAMSNP